MEKDIEKLLAPRSEIKCKGCSGRCSDFDEDCNKVEDKLHCFLHGTWSNGQKQPQGYCPFIHSEN